MSPLSKAWSSCIPPSNLFTVTDIYTINRPDCERDLRLEHGFQDLEDKFTRIRNLRLN